MAFINSTSIYKKLITKEIESYGIIKLTEEGREFIKNPYSLMIMEDHNYDNITHQLHYTKKTAADEILFNILKDLRKKISKEIGLPPAIIFSQSHH